MELVGSFQKRVLESGEPILCHEVWWKPFLELRICRKLL
jgi:hypothetical protein